MKMMNYGCEGLNVVISGGTSGIGLATAEKFLRDGANVYILGRSVLRGAMAVQKLMARTERTAVYIPCDVTSVEDCRKAIVSIGGVIHILVNAAGVYVEQRLENVSEADISNIFDTNVKGTMFLTQASLPFMYGGGSIVNIASDAGISGNYGCPVYCASKGAIVALTKALALDYAPSIRVNCVCPADVDTPLLRKQLEDSNGGYTMDDMADAYPLGRIGTAEEVAHVICSVASPMNSFMTGSIIAVDGGLTAK
jgi:NAD(P)-dependent dehydrogenase (short-subunit alcohol dehydrogenase family)